MTDDVLRFKINNLEPKQNSLLMYAFENGLTQMVKEIDGSFIGVNIVESDYIKVERSSGPWSMGRVLDG